MCLWHVALAIYGIDFLCRLPAQDSLFLHNPGVRKNSSQILGRTCRVVINHVTQHCDSVHTSICFICFCATLNLETVPAIAFNVCAIQRWDRCASATWHSEASVGVSSGSNDQPRAASEHEIWREIGRRKGPRHGAAGGCQTGGMKS